MDKIVQYYKITNIKPEYHVLDLPYYKSSKKRIIFNGKELELHYIDEFQSYVEDKETFKGDITGSGESDSHQKIIFVNFEDLY